MVAPIVLESDDDQDIEDEYPRAYSPILAPRRSRSREQATGISLEAREALKSRLSKLDAEVRLLPCYQV